MSSVSEALVREYFELQGFLVRQHRKHIPRVAEDDEEIDFFVLNPAPQGNLASLPFLPESTDIRRIARGIVVVKGWHTETFSTAVMSKEPDLARFTEPRFEKITARVFGDNLPVTKILVLPGLPQTENLREQSIAYLREKGVDAVLPFRTILSELIAAVQVNRNYQKSDLLQLIRILKNYDLFREPQLELFRQKRRSAK